MILDELRDWSGAVEVNGVKYASVNDALKIVSGASEIVHSIKLYTNKENATESEFSERERAEDTVYKIAVRQYMTRPATPDFDFMSKWNNNIPMPLRIMFGTVEKETSGMVYMKLHGDIDYNGKIAQCCMRCGKQISNPVSRYFGMGPECGGHNYVNPFNTAQELKDAVEKYRKEYLQKITWEGWIVKSAIISQEEVK